MYSKDEALSELQKQIAGKDYKTPEGQEEIRKSIKDVVALTSTEAEGDITILYSGSVNGVSAPAIAATMADEKNQNSSFRILDETQAFALLTDPKFLKIHAQAFGYDSYNEMMSTIKQQGNYYDSDEMQFSNNGKDGYWAIASANFVAGAKGRLMIISDNPRENSVAVETEINRGLEINDLQISHFDTNILNRFHNPVPLILDVSARQAVASNLNMDNWETWMNYDTHDKYEALITQLPDDMKDKLDNHSEAIKKRYGHIPTDAEIRMVIDHPNAQQTMNVLAMRSAIEERWSNDLETKLERHERFDAQIPELAKQIDTEINQANDRESKASRGLDR